MQKPLLSQLIKLEEMFEETRKSGTPCSGGTQGGHFT